MLIFIYNYKYYLELLFTVNGVISRIDMTSYAELRVGEAFLTFRVGILI